MSGALKATREVEESRGGSTDDQLFTLSKRVHPRERFPGSGIGLALCKRTVERHDGRIWVESEEGEGAAFSFTLPAANTPIPDA